MVPADDEVAVTINVNDVNAYGGGFSADTVAKNYFEIIRLVRISDLT